MPHRYLPQHAAEGGSSQRQQVGKVESIVREFMKSVKRVEHGVKARHAGRVCVSPLTAESKLYRQLRRV